MFARMFSLRCSRCRSNDGAKQARFRAQWLLGPADEETTMPSMLDLVGRWLPSPENSFSGNINAFMDVGKPTEPHMLVIHGRLP